MVNLSTFSKYKVDYVCKYSYINEEGDFSNGEVHRNEVMDGGKFLDWIGELIQDDMCVSLSVAAGKVFIEYFNPMNGEGSDHSFIYKEIKDSENT